MNTEYPDKLKKFFNELETRRTLLTTVTETHNKLINEFISLDETLTKQSQILDTQIENFKQNTEKTLESLTVRENGIPEKESALASRVEQLKDSAIRDIERGDESDPEDKTLPGMLRMWFRRMDSKGLIQFLLAKRKESVAVRAEITAATEEAVDILAFVLEAVEGFIELKVSGTKVKGMADRRWACGILIQAGLPLLADSPPVMGGRGVAGSIKERAAKLLEVWKGVLGGGEGSGGVGSGEATMFLQMVVGFGLKHKFDEDFLRQLVLEFASRREMAKLAVALGFGDQMRDIIEEFVKIGKEIEAVYFAYEAGLTEQFPPIPLLKSSIRKHQKNTSKKDSSLDDINNDLNIVRTIMKCIEDHKLEPHFTNENLPKWIQDLERLRSEKKRAAPPSTSEPTSKRSRREHGSGSGGGSRPPKAVRLAMAAQRNHHPAPPSAARFSAPYSFTNPSVYESSQSGGLYAGGYGGVSSRSPSRAGFQYAYPAQDMAAGTPLYDHSAAALAPTYAAAYHR